MDDAAGGGHAGQKPRREIVLAVQVDRDVGHARGGLSVEGVAGRPDEAPIDRRDAAEEPEARDRLAEEVEFDPAVALEAVDGKLQRGRVLGRVGTGDLEECEAGPEGTEIVFQPDFLLVRDDGRESLAGIRGGDGRGRRCDQRRDVIAAIDVAANPCRANSSAAAVKMRELSCSASSLVGRPPRGDLTAARNRPGAGFSEARTGFAGLVLRNPASSIVPGREHFGPVRHVSSILIDRG